jgi:O-antigen biosynthesis protein WbqP
MKRFFDFILSILLIILLFIPIIMISILIRLDSKGPILFWSKRIGKNDMVFSMPKFRSMKINTPIIATDLMTNPDFYLSSIGRFLRRYSIDEIPQIFSIVKGDMSFVGPRPALFNQNILIEKRKIAGVNQLTPGITGWAQVNGRDNISDTKKVELDTEYLINQSFLLDLKIIFKTFVLVLKRENVLH